MKTYRRVLKFAYWVEVEREAENEKAFNKMVDNMTDIEICGGDMIPVNDLEFELYGDTEEVEA